MKVSIKQPVEKEDEVPVELLAESIREISAAIVKLRKGPLKEETLLFLIKQNCKPVGKRYPKHTISVKEIKETLRSIETLSHTFLR